MKTLLQTLIKLYALAVSPFLGRNCRFHPTCSAYTHQAIEIHGPAKGTWLGMKRICKCHPLYKGPANDPVPPKKAGKKAETVN